MDEFGDFDNNDEYEDLPDYDYRIEPLSIVEEGFSAEALDALLMPTCLLPENTPAYIGNMEKLVFVLGNDSEVYSPEEIHFTEQVDSVIMYQDFEKSLSRGVMKCRVIAANIEQSGHNALKHCVAFEKITNKALDGFNIFFFITEDCAYLGCKIFDKTSTSDCIISNPIITDSQLESIIDELMSLSDSESFSDFYGQLSSLITSDRSEFINYEEKYIKKNNMSFTYYENILISGHTLSIPNYNSQCNDEFGRDVPDLSFEDLLAETEEYLSFIKSNRVNTYEMLFEAEEMMMQAVRAEEENERLSNQENNVLSSEEYEIDSETSKLLNDPEEMIKLLKKKRGL